jgi:hypothetical protein
MSRLIKESFAPKRRDLMSDYRRELLMVAYHQQLSSVSFFSCPLQKSLVGVRNLAEASLADLSMIVLLGSLLVITLLLPWIL